MHQDASSRTPQRLATGLRDAWRAGYGIADLRHDVMAGLTIGTVAVPLSMALAIATGVPPQHGLYTAIVAGAIIALTGGSRVNISGPTAAFVVILFPIVQQYGLGGLLIATLMAGLILVALGIARLGKLIQFVPYPVVLGFTSGIAVVIAVLQIPDFLGLSDVQSGAHFIDNLRLMIQALPSLHLAEATIGLFTLGVLVAWPRLKLALPAPLVGLIAGALAAYAYNHWLGASGQPIDTIASRFTWEAGALSGTGIPPLPPTLVMPWHFPGPDGQPLVLSFELFRALLGPAFAIAMLAAIESLLCAVIADGLTRTRHDPNAELLGQGLGNIVAPFFGGITATAAIARTATNIRSGARSPIAAIVHSLVILLAVLVLANVLGMVPMASMAALLFVVAWNMSEARHFTHALRSAPSGDVAILLVCFTLTVLFDMVLAVAVGTGLAAALFIRRMAMLTQSEQLEERFLDKAQASLPPGITIYRISGPMFFGAAEKALTSLRMVDPDVETVIVDMREVPSIDGTAIVALGTLIDEMQQRGVALILAGTPTRILVKLHRSGIRRTKRQLTYTATLERAMDVATRWSREEHESG